jgi:hypothetical protein
MSECLLDYPHAALWCPACWADLTQVRIANEATRANDLKERELGLREHVEWVEPKPQQPQQTYVPLPPEPKARQRYGEKGGMQIEPDR